LDHTVWGGKTEAIVESEKYDTLTVNELFSKLKSAEVDRGVTAKIEGPADSHSLAVIGGSKGKTNANPSTKMFFLSSLMSIPDEEFDVLGEDELALLTRRFERLHENQVSMRRNTSSPIAWRRSRTRIATNTSRRQMASTVRGVTTRASTRASTRTSDDRGRRRAEARPECCMDLPGPTTSTRFPSRREHH
jgi:hypothetical protein